MSRQRPGVGQGGPVPAGNGIREPPRCAAGVERSGEPDPDVVYVETLAGDIYLEQPADVTRYSIAFDRLLAAAMHPDDSVRLIREAAGAL